jgi:hypothetical protein
MARSKRGPVLVVTLYHMLTTLPDRQWLSETAEWMRDGGYRGGEEGWLIRI